MDFIKMDDYIFNMRIKINEEFTSIPNRIFINTNLDGLCESAIWSSISLFTTFY